MRLVFEEEDKSIKLDAHIALRIELALNLSEHKREWLLLGDRLYDWSIGRAVDPIFKVDKQQYEWVVAFIEKHPSASPPTTCGT